MLELPVIFQVNADFHDNRKKRKIVKKLIKSDKPLILGSDCHNVENRKPNLISGYDYISDKYGQNMVEQIDNLGREVLGFDTK